MDDEWEICPVCALPYPSAANPQGCPNRVRRIKDVWVTRTHSAHEAARSLVTAAQKARRDSRCAPCSVCGTCHFNACPALWGGRPERPTCVHNQPAPHSATPA